MKIKISDNIKVGSSTLIRLEWRKFLPVLIVHEKFENKIKWILRTIAFIGIATSLITIDKWYYSLGLSILIFLVEQFFERTIFEYTTFVVQSFPDFTIEYDQWKTNGFMIPMTKNEQDLCYAGPSYQDKEYAIKFFNYLKSWNWDSDIDTDNNIVLSFIIEPNERYSTYLYANTGRKNLNEMFKTVAEQSKFEKYGKKQQQLVMQMIYWHTLDFKDGYYIKTFLEFQKTNEKFYLTPSVIPQSENGQVEFIFESAILKFGYKSKYRHELNGHDIEFHYPPAK